MCTVNVSNWGKDEWLRSVYIPALTLLVGGCSSLGMQRGRLKACRRPDGLDSKACGVALTGPASPKTNDISDSSALVIRISYISQMCLLGYKASNFGADSSLADFLLGSTMKMEVICSYERCCNAEDLSLRRHCRRNLKSERHITFSHG
jgi:hypothetical protein